GTDENPEEHVPDVGGNDGHSPAASHIQVREREAGGSFGAGSGGSGDHVPEAVMPAQESDSGEDGDFADFQFAADGQAKAPEEDEDWEFAPVQAAAGQQSLRQKVSEIVETWAQTLKPPRFEPEDGEAPDWEAWLDQVPPEARDFLEGAPGPVPFEQLGVDGQEGGFGSKVREHFFNALGKHLQLPKDKDASAPSSPSGSSPKAIAAQAKPIEADWGLLAEPSHEPQAEVEADVLSQALSSVGLAPAAALAPGVPDTSSMPPAPMPEPKKKKGMTHKVKSFLGGLPDLKHLYSKSVVT
ncbi:unnamed protein product, partial [Effrenium voratum]